MLPCCHLRSDELEEKGCQRTSQTRSAASEIWSCLFATPFSISNEYAQLIMKGPGWRRDSCNMCRKQQPIHHHVQKFSIRFQPWRWRKYNRINGSGLLLEASAAKDFSESEQDGNFYTHGPIGGASRRWISHCTRSIFAEKENIISLPLKRVRCKHLSSAHFQPFFPTSQTLVPPMTQDSGSTAVA